MLLTSVSTFPLHFALGIGFAVGAVVGLILAGFYARKVAALRAADDRHAPFRKSSYTQAGILGGAVAVLLVTGAAFAWGGLYAAPATYTGLVTAAEDTYGVVLSADDAENLLQGTQVDDVFIMSGLSQSERQLQEGTVSRFGSAEGELGDQTIPVSLAWSEGEWILIADLGGTGEAQELPRV